MLLRPWDFAGKRTGVGCHFFLQGIFLTQGLNLDEQELGRAINRFLGTVSADNRTLFLRRYWFGDPVRLIARDLGLRENTANVRLNRLRMQLREYLIKEGYVDE